MTALATALFDYNAIPTEDRLFLKETTGAIRFLARATAIHIINIGNHLAAVHDRLPSHFESWIESETAISIGSAYKMIRAAEAFSLPQKQLEQFDPTALYTLSQWSVPKNVRDMAIEMAGDGEKITGRKAKEIVQCFKTKISVSKQDVKEYKTSVKEVETADTNHKKKFDDTAKYETNFAAWNALIALANNSSMMIISRVDDLETPDDNIASPWRLQIYPQGDKLKPRSILSSDGLEAAFLEAAGMQPERECSKCKKTFKLYDGFSRKNNATHGRSSSCRSCEVSRVGESKRKTREGRFNILKSEDATGLVPDGKKRPAIVPPTGNLVRLVPDDERSVQDRWRQQPYPV